MRESVKPTKDQKDTRDVNDISGICRSSGAWKFPSGRCYNDAAPTALPPIALGPLHCQRKILPETSNFASPPAEPEGFLLD